MRPWILNPVLLWWFLGAGDPIVRGGGIVLGGDAMRLQGLSISLSLGLQ